MPTWVEAGLWGLLGGGALVVGALIAWLTPVPPKVVASVMAFGSGVLISAVAFDLVEEAVAALAQDGHTAEFIRDQFRHCKTILALGAAQRLLVQAGLPPSMDKSLAQGATGLLVADAGNVDAAAQAFIRAMGRHRHFGREMDPPLL